MTSKCKTQCAKNEIYSVKFRMIHALCSTSNLRAREKKRKTSVQADSQSHVSHYHELMMLCLACQLLFLTGYYFTIYAKQNTLPAGRWNTISDGVTQTSLFRVQQKKQETSARRQTFCQMNWNECNNNNNNKLYLHDHYKALQYCKSYLKLIIDSL